MKQLSVLYRREGKEVLAQLKGSLVALPALNLTSALKSKINEEDRLIVDLTKVTEVDTTGLNTLYQTRLSCDVKNSQMILKLTDWHPLRQLLSLTRSERDFEIQLV